MEAVEEKKKLRSPGEQDSIIPKGWKPTREKPVPVVQCVQIKKNGERCGRWSLRGLTKCRSHLHNAITNFPNLAAYQQAVIEAGRLRIVDSSDDAIDALVGLLQPGTAEGIMLRSATELLDRAGIRGGTELDVQVEDKTDAARQIRDRLDALRSAVASRPALDPADDVLNAEVVEPSNQLSLFGDDT